MTERTESPSESPLGQSVALLGTGTMGAGMARNIAAARLPLTVWNRTPDKAAPLRDVGVSVAASPAEAVDGADVVVTMLFDGAAVAEVMAEAAPALTSDAVWLQTSTVGVAGCDELAALAARLGLTLVDAPVLGTRQPAEQGALVVLASGPEDARPRVVPVLDAIGSRTLWLGDAGAGSRLKMAVNTWVLTVVEGVSESLALARELGLDPAMFLEAVAGSPLDAPYVQLKGKAMLAGEHDPAFGLDGAVKDAGLVTEAAQSVGLDLAVLDAVRTHLARAAEAGHGSLDMSATYLEHRPHR
jgi:3-hydroxyisobutyrate dehydrogenase